MAKLILPGFVGPPSASQLNVWKTLIEQAIQEQLSRDGTLPNHMEVDIDLNSNDILNADTVRTNVLVSDLIDTQEIKVKGITWTAAPAGPGVPDGHASDTNNPHNVTAEQVDADPAGTASSAVSSHESAADPHTVYMRKSQNLSDLNNTTTARTNLGLGTAAVEADTRYAHRSNNLSDLANAATARTNLGGNAAGARTVSTDNPSGGANGDIWYKVD